MAPPLAAQPTGIDAALLGLRKAWFGTLFILSRDSKATTAAFAVTVISDLIQFSVFPILIASSLAAADEGFRTAGTVMSISILDIDTLFALTDGGSAASSGRALLYWAAFIIVTAFMATLGYVMVTLLSEGRQQAIVLKILGSMASILTTVAFMPVISLLLSIFHACASVDALGVQCRSDAHLGLQILNVILMVTFAMASTFFAAVYIDTDLSSTTLGAKTTGRLDAAMLVSKLILVTGFTALSLDNVVRSIAVAAQAIMWFSGVLFWQPYVQPLANNLAAAAAGLNLWMVMSVIVSQISQVEAMGSLMGVGVVAGPLIGATVNSWYRGSVAASDFVQLRSAMQADIWARARIAIANRLSNGPEGQLTRERSPSRQKTTSKQPTRTGRHRRPSNARSGFAAGASMHNMSGMLEASGAVGLAANVQPLADGSGAMSEQEAEMLEGISTRTILPNVSAKAMIRQAGAAYDEMLSMWPKSPVTYSSGSLFQRAYGSTVSSELTILALARKQVGSAWDVAFLSYQRTRQLQESSSSGLSAMDRILFEEAWSAAVEDAIKCFGLQNKMWAHAVESNPDVAIMGQLAEDLYRARTAAERRFKTMLQINPDSVMALTAYSRFCTEVLGDSDRATELSNMAQRIETKHAKMNVKPLEAVSVGVRDAELSVMDEHNAVVTMTGELRRHGEITDVNTASSRLFGRGRSDLMGQSVSSLFPEPLGSFYDQALLAYLSPHDRSEAFSRGTHVTVILTAGGWLVPARISLQEGAGSELDVTPCLSMVIQPAPSKRHVLLLGSADEGFPVIHSDTESMLLLDGWAQQARDVDESEDESGDDVDRPASGGGPTSGASPPLTTPMGSTQFQQASLRGQAGQGRTRMGGGGISDTGAARMDLSMLRWLPGLPVLAEVALVSSLGAQADLKVALPIPSGPVRRVSQVDDAVAFSSHSRGGVRFNSSATAPDTAMTFNLQALHSQVLIGRRARSADDVSHWLLTWEAARTTAHKPRTSRHLSPAAATGAVSLASSGRSQARRMSAMDITGSAGALRGAASKSDATQLPHSTSNSVSSVLHDPRRPAGITSDVTAVSSVGTGKADSVTGADGEDDEEMYATHSRSRRGKDDGNDGMGSVMSAGMSTRTVVKRVVESALSNRDPSIRSVYHIVFVTIAAVIAFAIIVAGYLPADQQSMKQLVLSSSLASRRAAHAEVALGMWYRMLSVSFGFTAVDSWDMLTSNMTSNVDKMEASHRQLLALAQSAGTALADFEEERTWDTCVETVNTFTCARKERYSATALTEFVIFHLRQIASFRLPTDLSTFNPATGGLDFHPSLELAVVNLDLLVLCLKRGENIAAMELSQGASRSLLEQTAFAVTAAVLIFSLATFGTTYFAGRIGHKRFAMLSGLANIPSRMLRRMVRTTEDAQGAYARFIGADTGDDDVGVDDLEMDTDSPRGKGDPSHGGNTFSGNGAAMAATKGRREAPTSRGSHRVAMVVSSTSQPARGQRSTGLICCRRPAQSRKTRDSSCFVGKAALTVTSPLALVGGWIAVLLVMVAGLFDNVLIDSTRSVLLFNYATAASMVRGRIEVALFVSGEGRFEALEEARTNATVMLESLGDFLNGVPTSILNHVTPSLSESGGPLATDLFNIVLYDSCLALEPGSFFHTQCTEDNNEFNLRGLFSLTTAMVDESVRARSIFNASSKEDTRSLGQLIASGALPSIVPALRRYNDRADMAQIVAEHLINRTLDATMARFDQTWSDVQVVLASFTTFFMLIVWAWVLPSVRGIERTRHALYSVLLTLPEDVILGSKPVMDQVIGLANSTGMAQAARALRSMSKSAVERARPSVQVVHGHDAKEVSGHLSGSINLDAKVQPSPIALEDGSASLEPSYEDVHRAQSQRSEAPLITSLAEAEAEHPLALPVHAGSQEDLDLATE